MKPFFIGLLIGFFVLFPLAIYLYVKLGFLSLATTARPLPLEQFIAQTALQASVGAAKDKTCPLPVTDENLLGGAKEYREHCAVCHGLPGQPVSLIAKSMFPKPPQLLGGKDMVTDDPEGATFWKVSNGIRLSGMPGFGEMPETGRWQVTMLLKHADKLPVVVQTALSQPPVASH